MDSADISSPAGVLNGLSAKVIFTLDTESPTGLKIELFNTSTGVPAGFDNSDQLLTGISFDFGHPGFNGDAAIVGGTVVIGPGGQSYNFNNLGDGVPQLVGGDDISGEWGYGNFDGSGMLTNFVSGNKSGATRFGTVNLDGPDNIDGPQGGICTNPPTVPLGGLGSVGNSVVINITVDSALTNLDFLRENGVMAEFGSDAAFVVPEPATVFLLGLGMLMLGRKKRV